MFEQLNIDERTELKRIEDNNTASFDFIQRIIVSDIDRGEHQKNILNDVVCNTTESDEVPMNIEIISNNIHDDPNNIDINIKNSSNIDDDSTIEINKNDDNKNENVIVPSSQSDITGGISIKKRKMSKSNIRNKQAYRKTQNDKRHANKSVQQNI